MRGCFTLILIPLVVVGQGFAAPHSHQGTHVATPAEHASRPHFHVGSHGRLAIAGHSHHHGAGAHHAGHGPHNHRPVVARHAYEHDADAVYCSGSATSTLGRQVRVEQGKLTLMVAQLSLLAPADSGKLGLTLLNHREPPSLRSGLPLFLRNLCIRC